MPTKENSGKSDSDKRKDNSRSEAEYRGYGARTPETKPERPPKK